MNISRIYLIKSEVYDKSNLAYSNPRYEDDLLAMGTDHQRFSHPAIARAFIRHLAEGFEEPEQMMEFLNALDIAQATFAFSLVKEHQYYCLLRTHFITGKLTKRESRDELDALRNENRQASAELQQAKIKLKKTISELVLADVDGILAKSVK